MNDTLSPASSFFDCRHHPYYIASPNFAQNTSGPRMLHTLCHMLNELGYEAYITSEIASPWLHTPRLTSEIVIKHKTTGRVPIAVYPEVVNGNPLQAKVVARWILNQAGHLGGDSTFASTELLFYWDEWVLKGATNAERLFFPSVDTRLFNAYGTDPHKRTGYCFYAHKYLAFGGVVSDRIASNGINLCQSIPRTIDEIVQILRQSRVLYCYEPSNMVMEAYACGCPTVLVDTPYLRRFDNLERNQTIMIPENDIDLALVPSLPLSPEEIKLAVETDGKEMRHSLFRFIERTQTAANAIHVNQRTPEYQLQEAIDAFHAEDMELSLKFLEPLATSLPDNPLPAAYLSFICASQGMMAEADKFIRQALVIAPDRLDLQAALGEIFLKSGNHAKAAHYLYDAIVKKPDMLFAYPALGRSMHLNNQTPQAVTLLESAAAVPSSLQGQIQSTLLEIQAERGNLYDFTASCEKYTSSLAHNLLTIRCLSRFEPTSERLQNALQAARKRIDNAIPAIAPLRSPSTMGSEPLRIGFIVADFDREAHMGRLQALLTHLSPEDFDTTLIDGDPQGTTTPYRQVCADLADQTISVHGLDDASARQSIGDDDFDILLDLDAYGPSERMGLFLQLRSSAKAFWGEAPIPSLHSHCKVLTGESVLPQVPDDTIVLPGMGECCTLPEYAIQPAPGALTYGCLTPAIRIGPQAWKLFAAVLQANPGTQLVLNLRGLGDHARTYIGEQFEQAGVSSNRLIFVQGRTLDELCQQWQNVNLGLAAPVDGGDHALTTCLWMGRPFIALKPQLAWSHRPAALLKVADASGWIAETPEDYVALSQKLPTEPDLLLRDRLGASHLNKPKEFVQNFAYVMKNWVASRRQTNHD